MGVVVRRGLTLAAVAVDTCAAFSLGASRAPIGVARGLWTASGRGVAMRRVFQRPPQNKKKHAVLAMNFWAGLSPKKEVNYEGLAGLPDSFAREASKYALRGEIPTKSEDGYAIATFAAGCFWGLELAFQRVPGVVATSVGYAQGSIEKPTYNEVCGGATGHTETVTLIYDPNETTYETLCNVFWDRLGTDALRYHQVGNDRGSQYRHGVYFNTEEQRAVAERTFNERQAQFGPNRAIQTEIEQVGIVWPAEEYHQQYLQKGGRFGTPQSAEKGATDPIRCYG